MPHDPSRTPGCSEDELAWQVDHVATGVVVGVLLGVIAGCLVRPEGVECSRHRSCGSDGACSPCLDVPGCGPICIDERRACVESCPLPAECHRVGGPPARLSCDGIVAGRESLPRQW